MGGMRVIRDGYWKHNPNGSPSWQTYKTFEERLEGSYQVDAAGCWLWTGTKTSRLYPRLAFGGGIVEVHRAMLQHLYGPLPPWLYACHKCNVPSCINPDHLYLGTPKDNVRDCIEAGRFKPVVQPKGIDHPRARLTESDVRLIRDIYSQGNSTQKELGQRFNVRSCTISAVVNKRNWRHI